MYNCTVEDCTLLYTCIALSILSVVMCMVAIAVVIYYKFYRSFNYRLILYLLISFLINTLITMIVYTLTLLPKSDLSHLVNIILIALYMSWSSIWSIQLCIAFMTAEIFSMVIFSVELQKAEVPLTIACFTLPLVELVGIHFKNDNNLMGHYIKYNAILGMVVTGICAIATAITLICLAYHDLQKCAINNDNEEQHLLHQHTRQRYQNALKESLLFIIYPAMILLWLLMYYILIYTKQITSTLSDTYHIFKVNTGTISSIVFFIHITIIGQRRRNAFKNRAHNIAPSHSNQEINEGQRITVAGSVTATHVTDFDPLGDSDVEP